MNELFIDWGGTNFRYIAQDEEVVIKPSSEIEILSELGSIFARHPDINKVGISFAGQVCDNKIYSAPNIAVQELDLNEHFNNIEFIVQNDLKCALLAESEYFNEADIAVLYIGTGIGSAYMQHKHLITGTANLAGEIGHIPYKPSNLVCGCGKSNCLELFASGSGLAKQAAALGLQYDTLEVLSRDKRSEHMVRLFEDAIGYAASLIVTMLNPKVLVVGGGIMKSNPYLLELIREFVYKNAFHKSAMLCKIEASQLDDGALDGAKLLFRK